MNRRSWALTRRFAPSRPLADLRSFFVARSPSSPKRPAYALIFAFLATTREGFVELIGFEPTFRGAHKALFAPSRPLADLRSFFVARSPSSPKRPAYALIFAFLATTREGFVELIGFEPTASSLRTKRSPS